MNLLKQNENIMLYLTETLKQANMEYVMQIDKGEHILYDVKNNRFELWATNKNFAGYTLKWRNTNLEFCHGIENSTKIQTRYGTFIAMIK